MNFEPIPRRLRVMTLSELEERGRLRDVLLRDPEPCETIVKVVEAWCYLWRHGRHVTR